MVVVVVEEDLERCWQQKEEEEEGVLVVLVLGVPVAVKHFLRYHDCSCGVWRAESLLRPPCSLYEHPSSRPGSSWVVTA